MTVKVKGKIPKQKEREIQQLHEDIFCLCDGLDPMVQLNVLANLASVCFHAYDCTKKDMLDSMSWLYDKHEEDQNVCG